MGYATGRVMLFDRLDRPLGDLGPGELMAAEVEEEINGEHTLTLETTRALPVGTRALTVDGTGRWREFVVEEPDELHETGLHATGTYRCVWSLQHDLMGVSGGELWAAAEAGTAEPITAARALSIALTGTKRWAPGTVTVARSAAASLYDGSAWDYLSAVVEEFGGEVDAEITVGPTGVTSRRVALLAHLGQEGATRRFDWGRDMTSIRRVPDPGPYYCRVVPRGGGGSATDGDGVSYSTNIGIEDETGGVPYIQDDEAAAAFRVPDGSGGWEYPTKVVQYSLDNRLSDGTYDPEELYRKALADLHEHTRPKVSYEADVEQLAAAGMDVAGVSLGDDVACVDRGFNPDAALRVEGRVVALRHNILDPSDCSVTIGQLGASLDEAILSLVSSSVSSLAARIESMTAGGTIVYLRELIDLLNGEINATGGYTYVTGGQGIRTYDKAVSDPLVGAEATKVVEIKGGAIRIADSKTSAGDWNWRTVFVSGHVAAELVTAANLVAGWIGNAAGSYWDLDRGVLTIGAGSTVGGTDAATLASRANGANSMEQLVYRSARSGTASMSAPTTWVTSTSDAQNAWTARRPTYSGTYPVLFVATQRRSMSGTVTCTTPVIDQTTTVIDGGHITTGAIDAGRITTGTLDASKATITNINASNIKSGSISGIKIYATTGTIGGFTIDSTSIHTSGYAVTSNATASVALSSANFTRTVAGASRSALRLAIGSKFGVTSDGTLYASSASISGSVTASSGTIGGFTIGSSSIYRSKSSLSSTANGVYVGIDGISLGSNFKVTSSGALTARSASMSGTFTSGSDSSYKATMNGTGIHFYYCGAESIQIIPIPSYTDGNRGGYIQCASGSTYLGLRAPSLYTATNTSSNGTKGYTGRLSSVTHAMASDMSSCLSSDLEFVNGLLVTSGW